MKLNYMGFRTEFKQVKTDRKGILFVESRDHRLQMVEKVFPLFPAEIPEKKFSTSHAVVRGPSIQKETSHK